jgi:IgA-specific serine endopeptidase
MSYDDLPADVEFAAEAPKADKASLAIRKNITQVETALTEFDKITAGLADLAERFPADLVYDVSTTKGMKEAIAHRAAWREPRILVEKLRKTAKAPVLALGKDIDARAAWITEQLEAGETPVDEQIKAEEARKEAEKQARINAEFGRVQAIQDAISEIGMDAVVASRGQSTNIRSALFNIKNQALDPLVFQEMMPQAEAARAAAVAKLEVALSAALHNEAEAAKVAAERAELEELRKAAAAQRAKDEAAAAEAARVERERLAVEQAAQRAEQARLDAEAAAARKAADAAAAAERAEADRIAREAREAEAAKIAAERAEFERAQAEARRAEQEKAAAEARQRAEDAAKAERLAAAAQALLDALVIAVPHVAAHGTADELAQCNAAIDAAA